MARDKVGEEEEGEEAGDKDRGGEDEMQSDGETPRAGRQWNRCVPDLIVSSLLTVSIRSSAQDDEIDVDEWRDEDLDSIMDE